MSQGAFVLRAATLNSLPCGIFLPTLIWGESMRLIKAAAVCLFVSGSLFAQHSHSGDRKGVDQPAPTLKRVGMINHKVATRYPKAQQYFNQGVAMVYAFNHLEAERSFNYAAQIDPKLPIAYWGVALALGSN